MKTINSVFLISIILFCLLSTDLNAQKKEKQHGPPSWAPAHGYRAKTRQIYFPEYNFYYDIAKGVYIYIDGGSWKVGAALPLSLGKIDLKASLQVELELNTDTPQIYNAEHVAKYKPQKKNKPIKEKPGKPNKGKDKKH